MDNKKKRGLIIALCILAVAVAIAAIILAPFGRKVTGKSEAPKTTESDRFNADVNTENAQTSADNADISVVIPSSTEPRTNPNKNYTFYIDKSGFDVSETDDGCTVLTAKEDGAVKLTVTPVRDMSYKQCCREAEKKHEKLARSEALNIENTNTAYRSQTGDSAGDIVTTVYCVDDNKGGCIIIDCRTPISATEYEKTIEIMLSMFKVI